MKIDDYRMARNVLPQQDCQETKRYARADPVLRRKLYSPIHLILKENLRAEVSGGREWGRPRLGWMDGAKVALGSRYMAVEGCATISKDR